MYKKILVPIDGFKPADKALDHAINLLKSISAIGDNKKELIILFLIPDLPVPLGFEKPMRSFKTGNEVLDQRPI
jgi:nucleotide-binding universal stress UspA family protein